MKKIIILAISLFFVSGFLFPGAIIINTPGPYNVGQSIGFDSTCHDLITSYSSVVWDFGDGTTVNMGTLDLPYGWQYHTYRNPGTYTVTFSRNVPLTTPGCSPLIETRNITINENRYIQVSPAQPSAGQPTQCTAVNFNTPNNIRWDMGDGTILSRANIRRTRGGVTVTHTYTKPGSYTVNAYDWNGSAASAPVSVTINVTRPARRIDFTPTLPRVDEPVYCTAQNFLSQTVDWNFGDNTVVNAGSTMQVHRFQTAGTFTVSAVESGAAGNYAPVTVSITVLPENRSISLSAQEIRINEELTVTANNFRGDFIWWNFGDGTQRSGGHEEKHIYTMPGRYTITAFDENGESQKPFQATVNVIGINDAVTLSTLEILLDNGKYYKVVPKNSKDVGAVLRMKLLGSETGIVSGYWAVDGRPFEFFSEVAVQGVVKEIHTRKIPGLPTIEPGLHTVTVNLTRPTGLAVQFPLLRYFVLPYEDSVKTVSPADGFIAKEKEIPEFSWEAARRGSKYQVAFSNYLYPLLENRDTLHWIDTKTLRTYTPTTEVWDRIKRNRWTYWKVRALDSNNVPVAESDVQDIKVVIDTGKITIAKVTDLDGNELPVQHNSLASKQDYILVSGTLEYEGDSKFLVLRVYAGDELVDQLLFRDVKKGEIRHFETSVPNEHKKTRVVFQVLKSSSPSIILGIHTLILKKN